MEEIYKDYLLSIQGALLGKVKPNLRAVAIGWDNPKSIKVKFVLDAQPTNDDWDLLSETCGEIIADFPKIDIDEKCEFSMGYPSEMLNKGGYKFLVYLRCEEH
jgi:hypothetical protein